VFVIESFLAPVAAWRGQFTASPQVAPTVHADEGNPLRNMYALNASRMS
jgi:hypothetical protein